MSLLFSLTSTTTRSPHPEPGCSANGILCSGLHTTLSPNINNWETKQWKDGKREAWAHCNLHAHSTAVSIDIKFSAAAYPYINNFISVNDILCVGSHKGKTNQYLLLSATGINWQILKPLFLKKKKNTEWISGAWMLFIIKQQVMKLNYLLLSASVT